MKTLIFPHVVYVGQWSFGIAIVNTGMSRDTVMVNIYNQDGLVKSYPMNVEPDEHAVITPADTGKGVFHISVGGCGDDIYGTFIRNWKGNPCSEVNAIEVYNQ